VREMLEFEKELIRQQAAHNLKRQANVLLVPGSMMKPSSPRPPSSRRQAAAKQPKSVDELTYP
jgi:hypothetical protein